jgi:hypothetical protein
MRLPEPLELLVGDFMSSHPERRRTGILTSFTTWIDINKDDGCQWVNPRIFGVFRNRQMRISLEGPNQPSNRQ